MGPRGVTAYLQRDSIALAKSPSLSSHPFDLRRPSPNKTHDCTGEVPISLIASLSGRSLL
jgi:hypothetical protein